MEIISVGQRAAGAETKQLPRTLRCRGRPPLRKWLVGEMFRLANEITSSAIQRKPASTPLQRLERLISSLRRTRAGREALRMRGIEEATGWGIVREE